MNVRVYLDSSAIVKRYINAFDVEKEGEKIRDFVESRN